MTNPARYTCFTLLINLHLGIITAHSQSTPVLNELSQSTNSATTKLVPKKAKASESAFYIKLYGLYGLVTPSPQQGYVDSYNYNIGSSPYGYQAYKTKLGLGPRAGIGLGVVLSDFVNIGLDADILFNKTPTSEVRSTYTSTITSVYIETISTTLKLLSVSPNVTFKALSRPSYYIYNRLGVVGGLVLNYQTNESSNNINGGGVVIAPSEELKNYNKNSLAIGYQTALGIQFRLSQKLRGFTEIVLYNQTFKPQSFDTTVKSLSSSPSPSPTFTTVVNDSGTYKPYNQPAGTPLTYGQPSFSVTLNSLSVGLGLVYRP